MTSRSAMRVVVWVFITAGGPSMAESLEPTADPAADPGQTTVADQRSESPVDLPVGRLTLTEQTRLVDLDSRRIQQFTNAELAEYLALRTRSAREGAASPHPREIAGNVARRTLGQPFRLNAVQFDPAEGDCVSCVNRQLALSLAWDWQSYVILTERIRHKDGIVEYRNRNFFTLQDWLPNNTTWLLDDITGRIGSPSDPPARRFTYPVRAKLFEEHAAAPGSKYSRTTFKGWDRSDGKTEVWPSLYIPTDRMHEVMPDLLEGDVVLVLRNAPEGHFDCDHVGMIVREADDVLLAHSVPPDAVRESLVSFLARCPWVVGLKFLRLRENAKQISEREVARLAPRMKVLSPAEQDARNAKLRASRAAASRN